MINNNELMTINGGSTSTTIINTVIKVINAALEMGRTIGTIIKRKVSKKNC